MLCFAVCFAVMLCPVDPSSLEDVVAMTHSMSPATDDLADADSPHGVVRSRLASMLRGRESNMM